MSITMTMSTKEAERIPVLEDVIAKKITQVQAAKLLRLSVRQVRRILKRYHQQGALGLIHGNRSQESNRALSGIEQQRIIQLIHERYRDFGPTLAWEHLREQHQVTCSVETVRTLMIEAELWKPKPRTVKQLYPYRERRACVGELVQLDGSDHDWFEGRAPRCTLLGFIDDATSRLLDGLFVDEESTWALFMATEHYLRTYGKPVDLYVDRHSTFKVNRQATIEEQLKDRQPQSQFARAMDQLAIGLIFALSPQAKGRVERLFSTLQDRLVKAMRLAGISTQAEATHYLREVYLPLHNAKFAVPAREAADLHRPLLPTEDLNIIFTIQSQRTVTKDLLVHYKKTRYQLTPSTGYRYTLRQAAVTVAENQQGGLKFWYKDQSIPFTVARQQDYLPNTRHVATGKTIQERPAYVPPPDHQWRRSYHLR